MEKNEKKKPVTGNYHNDYSPKYGKPYDIYDKAKNHVRKLKKDEKREQTNSFDYE